MWLRKWFRPPGHWLLLFLMITLLLAAAWGWLGIRLLRQERALESQRIQERLDHAADLVAAALVQSISKSEDQLGVLLLLPIPQRTAAASGLAKELGLGTLIIEFDSRGVEASPADRLLYYPSWQSLRALPTVSSLDFQGAAPLKTSMRFETAQMRLEPRAKTGRLPDWLKNSQAFVREDKIRVVTGPVKEDASCR